MKHKHRRDWMRSVIVIALLSSGCLGTRMDTGAQLIAHPQFQEATRAAPEWVALALDRIAELEARIEGN